MFLCFFSCYFCLEIRYHIINFTLLNGEYHFKSQQAGVEQTCISSLPRYTSILLSIMGFAFPKVRFFGPTLMLDSGINNCSTRLYVSQFFMSIRNIWENQLIQSTALLCPTTLCLICLFRYRKGKFFWGIYQGGRMFWVSEMTAPATVKWNLKGKRLESFRSPHPIPLQPETFPLCLTL